MRWLTPRFFLGLLGVLGLLGSLSLSQELNRRWQYRQEVQRLESEVQKLERNVIELSHLNKYFNTDAYQERLAREKLNYSAPGEKVVLVPQEEGSKVVAESQETTSEPQYSNLERWWRVLFVEE
jgi:cell division protein FtsB